MRQLWRDAGRDTRLVMWSYVLRGIGEGLWMFIQPLYAKSLGATPEQVWQTVAVSVAVAVVTVGIQTQFPGLFSGAAGSSWC